MVSVGLPETNNFFFRPYSIETLFDFKVICLTLMNYECIDLLYNFLGMDDKSMEHEGGEWRGKDEITEGGNDPDTTLTNDEEAVEDSMTDMKLEDEAESDSQDALFAKNAEPGLMSLFLGNSLVLFYGNVRLVNIGCIYTLQVRFQTKRGSAHLFNFDEKEG